MLAKLTAKRYVFTLVTLFLTTLAIAQKQVTGKIVNSSDKTPIIGATVSVKGTNIATQTNNEGIFSITVPGEKSILVFSSVGYQSAEMPVGAKSTFDVSLNVATSNLEEVIVTGYSTQKKKDLTGSVSVVDVKDMQSVPATTAENQLQGRAAGVTVVSNNQPGSVSAVRIRGFASFQGNDPLYVIDGVPAGSLLGINPDDIETFQVLKDAASASVYGSRASNGVVIITTKKGKAGGAKVSYSMLYGTQNPGKGLTNIATPQEQADLTWLALKNSGQDLTNGQYGSGSTPVLPDYILAGSSSGVMEGDPAADPSKYDLNLAKYGDPAYSGYSPYLIVRANKQGTNWFDALTRTSPITNHNITVSGGAPDKSRYMFSFNYLNQQGIEIDNFYKRYTVRANTEFNVKKNIRIGENIQIYTSEANSAGNNGEGTEIGYAYRIMPLIPVYNINGDFAGTKGSNLGNAHNPVAVRERAKNNRGFNFNLFGNMYAEVDFLKHFTARTNLGGTYSTYNYYNYPSLEYENSENSVNTIYGEGFGKSTEWVWTNQVNYKNSFGDHNISVLAGTEAIEDKGRQIDGQRSGFFSYTNLNYITFNSASTTNSLTGAPYTPASLFSIFGRADYNYQGKYLASVTVRRDGSSRFGEANRYGTFPSGSIGWRLSEENFMKNISWITDLKVRASYGVMGNQRINAGNQFTQFATSPGSASYDINGTSTSITPGFFLSFIGNTSGKWETNTTTDAGFDATLFNGKTEITFDWYQKKTSDLLYTVEQPASGGGTGAGNPPFFNVGSMKNWGIDIAATQRGNIGGSNGIKYDATLTFTTYKNTITGIAPGIPFFDFDAGEGGRIGGVFTRNAVGHPINSFYGYQVIGLFQDASDVSKSPTQKDAAPGRFKYKDANGDGEITDDDRVFFGNPNPDFTYGFNLNLSYQAFDLSAFFYGVAGRDAINYVKWWTDFYPSFQGAKSKAALYDSWTPTNTNAKIPIQENSGNFSTNGTPNSYYMENASYLRLKNLSLGYNFPSGILNKVKIDRFRVYVQATNLFTVTKYTGLDPEIVSFDDRAGGIDAGAYPTIKQFIVGAQINF